MRIFVPGVGGRLGRAVVARLSSSHDVVGTTKSEVDITDQDDVLRAFADVKPGAVVNAAAFTDVDGAERREQWALAVNGTAVAILARETAKRDIPLIHYGTDFVFDGKTQKPYVETDDPDPLGTYGWTKLVGEQIALRLSPLAYVLRLGPPEHGGSAAHILKHLQAREAATVCHDRTISPSFTADVAEATAQILERRIAPGLYHCASTGCTWLEFAIQAAQFLGVAPCLACVAWSSLPRTRIRPAFSVLSSAKLAEAGITMPTWRDALGRYLHTEVTA